jgi:hypothetical protein
MFLFNKNFANKDIVNQNDPFTKRLSDYWEYFEKHALTPIIVQSANSDPNPKSQIGPVEHILGNRHAPQQWEDPQQYADRVRKQNQRGADDARKFKAKGYVEGGPVASPDAPPTADELQQAYLKEQRAAAEAQDAADGSVDVSANNDGTVTGFRRGGAVRPVRAQAAINASRHPPAARAAINKSRNAARFSTGGAMPGRSPRAPCTVR